MWPVSGAFLDALGHSHAVTTRIEAWFGGVLVGTVDGATGTVSVTARNRVRRTVDLTVPEDLYPADDADLLHPYGTELRVWRGIDTVGEVPIFAGRIQHGDDRLRFDGSASIGGLDPFATINDARFETPKALPGTPNLAAIRQLIGEVFPDAAFVTTAADTSAIPTGLMWDRDRGQAVDDLATAAGVEVFADPGGTFHIEMLATFDDPAVWTLADGEGGTVVSDARTVSREGVYNVVVVIVERADGAQPLRVVIEDTDPLSPTRISGPFGRVPRFYRSPLITSEGQAQIAGRALLARSTGLTRTRTVQCVPNPALEAGDRIDIVVGGVTERHIADSFTLPIDASGGAMTIVTRSAKPAVGDAA
jgi:hypothetical protein